MKEGVKKERRRVRREWCGKNWKWIVSYVIPGLILAIVLYSISISFIVSKLQPQSTFNHLSECVGSSISKDMTELVVPSNRCNNEKMSVFDLSVFPQLKSIEIGNECFMYVNEVKLIGMKMLESVIVGENCFTKKKSDKNAYGLYVKNCELLRELKIGCYSFTNYSVCEIENVPSLEVIEIGGLDRWNGRDDRGVFSHASKLELKSDCSRMRMMTRFPQIDFHSVW